MPLLLARNRGGLLVRADFNAFKLFFDLFDLVLTPEFLERPLEKLTTRGLDFLGDVIDEVHGLADVEALEERVLEVLRL